jgi:NAD(P)-dependent dehydrogenase (short-subunit alcohol dehydrogenase family)
LANVLFTRFLARRLQGTGVTANCLHPGHTLTNFLDNVQSFSSPEERESNWRGQGYRPPLEGAKTPIYLASAPEIATVTGQYFENCKVVQPSIAGQDDVAAERLWAESLRRSGLKDFGRVARKQDWSLRKQQIFHHLPEESAQSESSCQKRLR